MVVEYVSLNLKPQLSQNVWQSKILARKFLLSNDFIAMGLRFSDTYSTTYDELGRSWWWRGVMLSANLKPIRKLKTQIVWRKNF